MLFSRLENTVTVVVSKRSASGIFRNQTSVQFRSLPGSYRNSKNKGVRQVGGTNLPDYYLVTVGYKPLTAWCESAQSDSLSFVSQG